MFPVLAVCTGWESPAGRASILALPGLILHSSMRAAIAAQATATSAACHGAEAPGEASHTFKQQHE